MVYSPSLEKACDPPFPSSTLTLLGAVDLSARPLPSSDLACHEQSIQSPWLQGKLSSIWQPHQPAPSAIVLDARIA